jgi:uncharacterized protein YbbK (DUF523 family)
MAKLVSACLLGVRCRYDGTSAREPKLLKLAEKERLVPICPEQLGGLPTPREPVWIVGGDGLDVLRGVAKVISRSGGDVTKNFRRGAEEALRIAKLFGAREAILKARSPSCGCGKIREPFSFDKLKEGDGVTAALLKKNGIRAITEEDL